MDILLGSVGYITSSVGFLFLLLLLLTTTQKSLQKYILLFCAAASSIWALNSALYFHYTYSVLSFLPIETLKNLCWFILLISTFSSSSSIRGLIRDNQISRLILVLLIIVSGIEISYSWVAWLPFRYILLIHLSLSALGLWLVEQLFRRTSKADRWTIKPLCLGLGMAYAYDFALFSNAVLTNRIDMLFFYGRGWITIVTIPLIIMTIRRVKHWSARIYVSREVVYSSTLLTVAGVYLLIMAITGYYIRYIGGDWGSMLQNVFFALSGLILASLFTSEVFRRKLRVFITKHFYANKYEYREEWIKFASVLEENVESPYQVSLNAMIRPFDSERGMLAVLEEGKFKKKAFFNLDESYPDSDEVLRQLSLNSIKHHWILDIQAMKNNRSKVPFEFSTEALQNITTFDYIVPISDNNILNGVCLISAPTSTHTLNWEDRDLMWAISKQLTVYLSLYNTNQTLAENQQFDTFNRMSTFLAHDLKNILAQLQLLAKNGKRHRDNPDFIDDAFETIDSAVIRLTKVVDHLKKKNLDVTPNKEFELNDIVHDACLSQASFLPNPIFQSKLKDKIMITTDQERFRNIIIHLIQNAQDATPSDGLIAVTTTRTDEHYHVSIEDSGSGMSEEFIENRLFKPFDTTKGNSGMGIGAYDAKKFIAELGGFIDVHSSEGKGSVFNIYIPLSQCVII
ncbi:PEP-CTERM system histidine kinase PrsK [Vibrio sp.]|nr:PEP-CTERM system histidine kinase PrsK [Vibrio sp.]